MNYHLIGIEGSAMSGLAKILEAHGNRVLGTDLRTTGHGADKISTDTERVVYTPAVREGSPAWPELEAARALGIETLRADELLGELTKDATLLAVTGAHGKSSTTAMLGHILESAGKNPTVLLGAPVPAWGGRNFRVGETKQWVLEADDYDRKFLTLHPTIAIVTNIDREHLDVYPDYAAIEEAFVTFVRQIRPGGTLIASTDHALDPVVAAVGRDVTVIRYGEHTDESPNTLPDLKVIGDHMRLNAAGARAAAVAFGIERATANQALEAFSGTGRRLEHVGEREGVDVYDDYGHHPTEIKATLAALKARFPDHRRVVAFQPHQHSRVHALFSEFATSFGDADLVLLADVYAVPGRDERVAVEASGLADAIAAQGVNVSYVGSLESLAATLDRELRSGDVFLTMGATDITNVGRVWVQGGES